MEAPQGVEPTGTNGETRHTTHHPMVGGHHHSEDCAKHTRHGTTVRDRRTTDKRPPSGPQPANHRETHGFPDNTGFAAAMAQGRRPDPFRTRKLRPGTAMVLHPTGRGRVARRRTTRTKNPRSSTRLPGVLRIPKPTRTGETTRHDTHATPPHARATTHRHHANRRKRPGRRRGNRREKTLSHGAGDTTQSDRGGQHVGITRIGLTGIWGKQREGTPLSDPVGASD